MEESISKRRLVENEAIFRLRNERIIARLDGLAKKSSQKGRQATLPPSRDATLNFYCECSDMDCRQWIKLPIDTYRAIHKKRDHFIVKPGHEDTSIEAVVDKETHYYVVQKLSKMSDLPATLS